jgi:hypothetical protein
VTIVTRALLRAPCSLRAAISASSYSGREDQSLDPALLGVSHCGVHRLDVARARERDCAGHGVSGKATARNDEHVVADLRAA